MSSEGEKWNKVATILAIAIDAPCDIGLPDGTRIRATAHVKQFGARNGMIVDPNFAVLRPFAGALAANGYGFSAMSLGADLESLVSVLADWGWSSSEPAPAWLSEAVDQDTR